MTTQEDTLLFKPTPEEGLKFPVVEYRNPLREEVRRALSRYFKELDGHTPSDIYAMVMNEVEAPLLQVVMAHADHNQSKAATMLGMNRGTLRKKLKQYGIL